MKKLAICLVFLGLTSAGYSQIVVVYEKWAEEIKSFDSNSKYLNSVQNEITPKPVKYLENMVSAWDINESVKSNQSQDEPVQLKFKSHRGYIIATYNGNGEVLQTIERFRNIALPKKLIKSIQAKYPNWSIVGCRYLKKYKAGLNLEEIYRVAIKNGKEKQWIRLNPNEINS